MKKFQRMRILKMSETNLIMYKKGECSFIRWLKKRQKHHNNTLIMIQGETGSGKSYSAIQKAIEYDSDFKIEQCVRDFREFMQLINADWFQEKKNKVVVFDEPQISISSRNWQSLTNKLMNYILSTFRHQQIVVFFVAPYKTFLDSQSMKLVHVVMTTRGIDRKKNLCTVKFSIEQYNPNMDKYYHHSLLVLHGGVYRKLNSLHIKMPRKEIINQYETRKTEFTSRLNADIFKQATELESKSGVIKQEPNAECKKCGYKWHTKSKYKLITCPSCHLNAGSTTTKEESGVNLNLEKTG